MQFVVLGWPDDEPTLRLDYRRFAYAGKFVMSSTGKAVVVDRWDTRSVPSSEYDRGVVAATAFNADRTDASTLWIRYVTVRGDRKGETLGPQLCAFVADAARGEGYETVKIAVNNPFAYEALHKAGFSWTGETTGIAELVLERPADTHAVRTREEYQAGLDRYRDRDLEDPESAFLTGRENADPPALVIGSDSDSDSDFIGVVSNADTGR
ncbi:GNAT family N-acetyltransferase [Halogeometricum borinquense]|uniref:GNAT family N-acetyltransferase n=1 Tax=Halogeometricum borinquense TaxID=60847 RepID=A0A6C0ULM7_9EURY|nr:GNAT family N-acetyltransferase [Halogeometricum borinquense]QIB74779.1 GNAT family N-acetyltransferase [Halogeometricum borinquense]QIQ76275.1 GNAT family N-acetyltransferase [Halogeometricum borinquense]